MNESNAAAGSEPAEGLPLAARDMLDFWFLGPDATAEAKRVHTSPDAARRAGVQAIRKFWFEKDTHFDALCRTHFEERVTRALSGALDDLAATPLGSVALILLLDQMTRNIHRGTPASFAGDERALTLARRLLESGGHEGLTPLERTFASMPFMHSERLDMQQQSVRLFEDLARGRPEGENSADYARRHLDVVARYGRFPHRNAILGRESTPEEVAFLKTPGSSF